MAKETKTTFVNGIVKAFDGFVKTFKKHGIMTVTFIMLLFLIFYAFILHPININNIVTDALKKESEMRIEQQHQSIQQRFEADKLINQLMHDIINQYPEVNRAMLMEIHDGSNSLSGLEYLFYSCTSEVINNKNVDGEQMYNIDYQADNFQRQHIANFIGQIVYNRLKVEKYLYFNNLDDYQRQTFRFINKLKDIGANSTVIIPFVNNKIPMALLVLTSKEDSMPAEKIYEYVERFRPQIERLLIDVNSNVN